MTWEEAENLILSTNLHRHAAVRITTAGATEEPWSHFLAFTNRLRQWQILFVSVPSNLDWNNEVRWSARPIRECTEEKQTMAAPYLRELIRAVVMQSRSGDVAGSLFVGNRNSVSRCCSDLPDRRFVTLISGEAVGLSRTCETASRASCQNNQLGVAENSAIARRPSILPGKSR